MEINIKTFKFIRYLRSEFISIFNSLKRALIKSRQGKHKKSTHRQLNINGPVSLLLSQPSTIKDSKGLNNPNTSNYPLFMIIITRSATKVRAFFLFYEPETNKILNYRIYEGKSYYKEFNIFVREIIGKLHTNSNSKSKSPSCDPRKLPLLIPQNYVSRHSIQISEFLGFTFWGYTQYDKMTEMMRSIRRVLKKCGLDAVRKIWGR